MSLYNNTFYKYRLINITTLIAIINEVYLFANYLYAPRYYTDGIGFWTDYPVFFSPHLRIYLLAFLIILQIYIAFNIKKCSRPILIINYLFVVILLVIILFVTLFLQHLRP